MSDPLRELVDQWRDESRFTLNCHDCAEQLEQELDRLEERNVSEDLSMSPQDFASLAGVQTLESEKRTEAKVHGFDHRFPQKQ